MDCFAVATTRILLSLISTTKQTWLSACINTAFSALSSQALGLGEALRAAWYWPWPLCPVQQTRPQRVTFEWQRLLAGTHVVALRAVAATPGTFALPPAKAYAVREPELMGLSAAGSFEVRCRHFVCVLFVFSVVYDGVGRQDSCIVRQVGYIPTKHTGLPYFHHPTRTTDDTVNQHLPSRFALPAMRPAASLKRPSRRRRQKTAPAAAAVMAPATLPPACACATPGSAARTARCTTLRSSEDTGWAEG